MVKRTHTNILQTEILRALAEAGEAVSIREILLLLKKRGIRITEGAIRKNLEKLSLMGYISKDGTKVDITKDGLRSLNQATIFERLGEFKDLVEYNMLYSTFDLYTLSGTVPTNVVVVDKDRIEESLRIMKSVADANLVTSRYIVMAEENENLGGITIPQGKVGIGTISSTIYNVIMLSCGVVLGSEFAGLLYYENYEPIGISEIINYSGTTISPGLLFIRGGYTSVYEVAETGKGYVLTAIKSFNEFAIEVVEREIALADARGIRGVLTTSLPMDNRLKLPVYKKALLITLAGINYIAPLFERGIGPELRINETLVEFSEFKNIDKFI